MHSIQPTALSRQHIVAALSIGSIALLMVGLQPILLGAMVDTRHASLEGVGVIAMSEIVALGIGVVLGDVLLPVSRLRAITLLAAIIISALDGLTALLTGDMSLAIVRAAAGVGEGVLVWVTTCVIVRSRTADRIAGIFLTVQTLAQTGVAAVLARAVIPHWSWQGGFVTLSAVALLPCVLLLWLPGNLKPLSHHAGQPFAWSISAATPLLISFVQMAALGSLWAYLEPIGQRAGLNAEAAQTAVSAVLFMQVVGGVVSSGAVRHLDNMKTLTVGAVVIALIPVGVITLPSGHVVSFIALCGAFGFAWLFLMPFQIGLALRLDTSGRVATLTPGAQLLGTAFGPLVSSLVVTGDDAGPVPYVTFGFAVSAIVVAIAAQMLRRRSRRTPRHA
ncbi:MFS transporter [Paraburkholderia ferrariae]|uniref:MFS transporter n=1 Tax=Paraburkholderia ferrariae TaxID=386056 RepID=UPI000488E9CE|nr:MFS transporter [Paraburkholderia ferrariae]